MTGLETIAAAIAGYLLKGVSETKGGKQAQEDFTSALWNWIRPIFIESEKNADKDNPKPAPIPQITELQQSVHALIEKSKDNSQLREELESFWDKVQNIQSSNLQNMIISGDVKYILNNPKFDGNTTLK